MASTLVQELSAEHRAFLEQAVAVAAGLGANSAVLLAGSRGAGYADSWSDLDLWILGQKASLPGADRSEYEECGQIFRDCGDGGAHWTFYDWNDLIRRLDGHPPVLTWVACNSKLIHGPEDRYAQLQAYSRLPAEVAERLLRVALGQFMMESGGGIARAARGDPTAGVVAAGRGIDAVARACLLADCRPYPYGKWLVRAARDTRMGQTVAPVLDEVASGIADLVDPPQAVDFRDWRPIARIRELRATIPHCLQQIGWSHPWARDLGANLQVAFLAGSV